jgi:predicted small secreted protein
MNGITNGLCEGNIKMKTYQRFVTALVVGALLAVSALGCNTFKGAGKDIQSGGRSVENAASGAQK